MTGRRDEVRETEPDGQTAAESPLERKIWIAAYVVVLLTLAAGAARRLLAMF